MNKVGWTLNPCNTLAPAFYFLFLFFCGGAVWFSLTSLSFNDQFPHVWHVCRVLGLCCCIVRRYSKSLRPIWWNRARRACPEGFRWICMQLKMRIEAETSSIGKQARKENNMTWFTTLTHVVFVFVLPDFGYRPSLDLRKSWKRWGQPRHGWVGMFRSSRSTVFHFLPTSGQARDWSYQVWRWREATSVGMEGRQQTRDHQKTTKWWMSLGWFCLGGLHDPMVRYATLIYYYYILLYICNLFRCS